MKLRHRLISWLSFGDALVMNLEILPSRGWRTKELGGMIVHNVDVRTPGGADYGIVFTKDSSDFSKDWCGFLLETTSPSQNHTIANCTVSRFRTSGAS